MFAATSRPRFGLVFLLTFLGCGCLAEPQPAEHTTERPVFDEEMPSFLFSHNEPAKSPESESAAVDSENGASGSRRLIQTVSLNETTPAESRDEQTGFTGAKVYVREACPPCSCLEEDLLWLAQNHGWSIQYLSPDKIDRARADWVIIRNYPIERYPVIEYYDNGKLIDTIAGYVSGDVSPEARDSELRMRIRSHPFSRRAAEQANQ